MGRAGVLCDLHEEGGLRNFLHREVPFGHLPEFFPLRHGFDENFGILYSNDMHPVQLIEVEKEIEQPVV